MNFVIRCTNRFCFITSFHVFSVSSVHCVQDAIRASGGLEAVMEALKVHQTHPGVAQQACFALGQLAVNNAANQVPRLDG